VILMRPALARHPVFSTLDAILTQNEGMGLTNEDDSRNNLRRMEPLALFGLGSRPQLESRMRRTPRETSAIRRMHLCQRSRASSFQGFAATPQAEQNSGAFLRSFGETT